jgi:hypothetical protein
MMKIDKKEDESSLLSRLKYQKVLQKQKSIEKEEEVRAKVHKQFLEYEEDNKRKRQQSVQKKRKKRKMKRGKSVDSEAQTDKGKVNDKLRKIDGKYKKLFEEVGLDIENFYIYKVNADGACGFNCTTLHCHHDETLGPYVRRNIHEYIVEFWPFFKPGVVSPHTQFVRSKEEPFSTESEYLRFLRKNPESGWLWMDWRFASSFKQLSNFNSYFDN